MRGEVFSRIVRQQEDAAWLLLADVVGDLGEGLGRSEAHATRDADPAEYLCAEALAVFDEVDAVASRRIDECLVYRILLNVQRLFAENRDYAARHVAVQLVVRRAEVQLARLLAVLELVVGRPHRDAECLELV